MKMVNLFDWDTVFGIDYATVNSSIKASGTSRKAFKYVNDEENKLGIEGVWGDWKITSSSDKKLYMTCPVTSGKFINGNKKYQLDNGYIEIEIELEAIKATSNSEYNLVQNQKNPTKKEFAIVRRSQFFLITGIAASFLETMFKMYFNSDDSLLNHIFASVTVNQQAITKSLQWLKPTLFSYALVDKMEKESQEGCFALLSKTDNSPPGQIPRLDPALIEYMSPDKNSVFAINIGLILKNMLAGNALLWGKNWSASDLKYEKDKYGNPSITNTKVLEWADLETEEGTVTPVIGEGKFRIQIKGSRIVLSIIEAEYCIDFKFFWMNAPIIGQYQVKLNIEQEFLVEYMNGILTTKEDVAARKISTKLIPSDGVKTFIVGMKILDIIGILLVLLPAAGAVFKWAAAPVEAGAVVEEGIELIALTEEAAVLANQLNLPNIVEGI
jgi:hypothetical protein